MKAWQLLAEAPVGDGGTMRLAKQDAEYIISIDGKTLMSSRMHGSEEALATAACQRLRTTSPPRVLIGGLGMGFTLAATLNVLPPDAVVTIVELVPAVVEWNRGRLGECAGHPLSDKRVKVVINDVGFVLRGGANRFDAILLDVDNGPDALTTISNHSLYDNAGVQASHAALTDGGVLAVWSAWEDRKFEQRLRRHGFRTHVERVRARLKKGGPYHTLFLGLKEESQ